MTSERNTKGSRRQTVKDTMQYLLATVAAQIIGLVRSVFMPILLGPAQLGIWNLMNVVVGYGANAHLGILHGMNKLIPLLRGEQKLQEIEILKNSIFWLNLSLGALSAALFFIGSFFAPARYFSYLCIISFIVFLQLIFFYQYSLLRANSLFGLVSRGVVIFSFGSTVFVLTLAFLFQDRVLGALIGLALAYLLVVSYWFLKPHYKFPLQINFSSVRDSFVIGCA